MEPAELLARLAELARAAGIEVREVSGAPGLEGGAPARSAVCRVRGAIWVVLSASDSLEERIDVVAGALGDHARTFLEGRFLPPALRARLRLDTEAG